MSPAAMLVFPSSQWSSSRLQTTAAECFPIASAIYCPPSVNSHTLILLRVSPAKRPVSVLFRSIDEKRKAYDALELKSANIFPQLVLMVSLGPGAVPRHRIVPPKHMKNIRRFQFQRIVRLPLLINQKWKRDSCLCSKCF